MTSQTQTTRSAALYERAQKILPGGISRNAVLRSPHPAYADHAEGCHITDIEGVRRIDFSNNMASMIHGHADPDVVGAVTEQLTRGTAFMMATEVEIEYAEHLCSRNDAFEMLRFVNSGTEAVMLALKASRAHTGRPMIAKAEGAYHGVYDYAEVSQASTPETWGSIDRPESVPLVYGTPESALRDVVIFPYNDIERTLRRLDEHKDELACVLLDLMPHRVGLNTADQEFVDAIYDWTRKNGALLVLDEVITFRTEYGGLQTRYGVSADLTAMGKMIGGGFPIGAVAGRADVMDILNPHSNRHLFPHSGTYTANPVSMTAGLATMRKYDAPTIERLNGLADRAKQGIERAIADVGITACVTGTGSMFRVHLKERAPRNFRDAFPTPEEAALFKRLIRHLFDNGLLVISTGTSTLSTPMTEREVDDLIAGFRSGFKLLKNG